MFLGKHIGKGFFLEFCRKDILPISSTLFGDDIATDKVNSLASSVLDNVFSSSLWIPREADS